MSTVFQIQDYYSLLALHKALMQIKFAPNPLDPVLSGSPLIAETMKQIVEVLAEMEIERGQPRAAEMWRNLKINPSENLWRIALERVGRDGPWLIWSIDKKREFATILLSPFKVDDDLLNNFIQQADQYVSGKEEG